MHRMTRVVDLSNSTSFEDATVMKFFQPSTRNLLAQGAAAGARHPIALSVVGTERLSESGCRLRRSTQHLPEVYSQGSGILGSFAVVDSSAARPGRAALGKSQTGQCLAGSIAVTADWCFRSYRAARGSADRRSRPAHS